MVRRLYITGCARSGTTLLARMFYAFDQCQVMNEECNIYEFCGADIEGQECDFLVGKRTEYTIFSNTISDFQRKNQLNLIAEEKLVVINCIRDGRNVVEAWERAWGVYDPNAWMNSILQSLAFKDAITLTVRYEDLLSDPDSVQLKIMEAIGIEKTHLFSEYPEFVPEYCFASSDDKYKLRKLDAPSDIVPANYLKRPNDIAFFEELLIKLDYACAESL